jgi:hypothetical protein
VAWRRRTLGIVLLGTIALAACSPIAAPAPPAPPPPAPPPPTLPTPPRAAPYSGTSEPLTVLLAGDSTMWEVGDDIAAELAALGYPAVIVNKAVGASGVGGPFPPNNIDWLARFDQLMAEHSPDIVVWKEVGSSGSLSYDVMVQRATIVVERAHAAGVPVAWCLMPAIISSKYQPYYDGVRARQATIPADAHPDWYAYLTPGGRWVDRAVTDRGVEQIGEGDLHLAAAGERIAARVTVAAIAQFWPAAATVAPPPVDDGSAAALVEDVELVEGAQDQ